MQKTRTLNKTSATLQPVLPRWKRMQRPSPVAPTRQDPVTILDMVMALQPLGPLGSHAKGDLMTVELRGVDLILPQAPKMNMHGVPSFHSSHVSKTTLRLLGKIKHSSQENQSRFIA